MIRIIIELIPYGIESEKTELSTIEIINDGSGTNQFGNYLVVRNRSDKENQFPANDTIKIKRYNRFDGYMKLIQKVINKFTRLDNG